MFRYLKVGPEGDQRRRNIFHLHLAEEAIIHLPIPWRGPSLPLGGRMVTLLRLHCRLRQDGQGTLTTVMARGTAMGWSITMRDSEPARTARWATTTGAPSPLRRRHPRRWLESASVWQPMTRTSAARSHRRLLRPPWWGTGARSGERPLHLLRPLVMGTPTSGHGFPQSLGHSCIQPHAPGTVLRREHSCRHLRRHPDIPAIRTYESLIKRWEQRGNWCHP